MLCGPRVMVGSISPRGIGFEDKKVPGAGTPHPGDSRPHSSMPALPPQTKRPNRAARNRTDRPSSDQPTDLIRPFRVDSDQTNRHVTTRRVLPPQTKRPNSPDDSTHIDYTSHSDPSRFLPTDDPSTTQGPCPHPTDVLPFGVGPRHSDTVLRGIRNNRTGGAPPNGRHGRQRKCGQRWRATRPWVRRPNVGGRGTR